MSIINIADHGARPNNHDNTDAIQEAMNAAGTGDTVYVPNDGEFRVDPLRGVKPRSGTTLKIDGALRAIPVDQYQSAVVNIDNVFNVKIIGAGAIAGERYGNTFKGPARHGTCLNVVNSTNIFIAGIILKEGQGDGLYVEGCKNVIVDFVICSDNARNGLSIIAVETMRVTNCTFAGTHSESPMPQAGIDIEPDLITQPITDLIITGNRFLRNKGAGCYVAFEPGANRRQVHVVDNFFDQHFKDGSGPPLGGINTPLGNFLYATMRWVPSYDYWGFKTSYDLS